MAFKLFDNVMESSTTTGTGDFTLAGAITGFSTFSSRYSTGDTCYYAIKEVDAVGGPSGAWEVGIGTYSAASTLTRTTVLSSSNSDSLVNFAAGTKRAFVTLTAQQGSSIREKLTAVRTYYVRTDGNDSNNGLENTSGGAFLTIQKAVDVISSSLDIALGVVVTIQIGDGTYTSGVSLKKITGPGSVTIQGNTTYPSNTIISTTSSTAITADSAGQRWTVKALKLQTTTSGKGLYVSGLTELSLDTGIDFGQCAESHIMVIGGAVLNVSGVSYTISGGASSHIGVYYGSYCTMWGGTTTITGTPAFSVAFCYMTGAAIFFGQGRTYSGSATGSRYNISLNSVLDSGTTLPGNSAGTTATGGQYV